MDEISIEDRLNILAANMAGVESALIASQRQSNALAVELRDLSARLDEAVRRGYLPSA